MSWDSRSPNDTEALGRMIGLALTPGDCVLLMGQLGAGKSHFARAAIRARLGNPSVEVPSPSYTIVNVHPHQTCEIWHVDLYRLGSPDELDELGLEDAVADTVMLVEWGERWLPPPPRHARLELTPLGGDTRRLGLSLNGEGWDHLVSAAEGFV